MRLSTTMLGVSCGFLLAAAGAGCGSSDSGGNTCTADQVTGTDHKYVTNSLSLPSSATPYSLDFDGSGKQVNQLKSIISGIMAAGMGLDIVTPINDAVASGSVAVLSDVVAPTDLSAGCAKTTLYLAQPRATGDKPKYDGNDTFMSQGAGTPLFGKIDANKALNTTLPKDQTAATVQKVSLMLPLAGGALPLTLWGAHIQGQISDKGVMNGQLHGVIKVEDIMGQIIPAIATLLTEQINKAADPTSGTISTIITLFEDPATNDASKAKCMVAKDCCQKPENRKTCKILPAEVASNGLVGQLLSPDIQAFQNGQWSPVPKGAMKDAMTVGLGFTMVGAKF